MSKTVEQRQQEVSLQAATFKVQRDLLLAALELLVADVQDYEAWQRPCHALDVARAAIKGAKP